MSPGLLFCNSAAAKDKPWYKYENRYFEAYSNESERTTRKLLIKLEDFRAAVLQVATIETPEGTPKTQVILFASEKRFRKLIGNRNISGFALEKNGVPYIVLPAGAYSKWTEMVIRHEFAHILLAYKNIRYPIWFNEGFAELMSATAFRKNGTQFSVGQTTGRKRSSRQLTPWSELIAADFDPHTLKSAKRASDAYLQSWILTHYFMLGNKFNNAIQLAQYISLLLDGYESVSAFEAVVGMPADEFGEKLLREYQLNYVYYEFRKSAVDHDFQRSDVAMEKMLPVIEQFRDLYKKD